jgi:cold shock CspA family protein
VTELRDRSTLGPARGTVTAFDDAAGWGTVALDDGRALFFHCVAIAGGSRTIAIGTPVRLVVRPGQRGRFEAWDVETA